MQGQLKAQIGFRLLFSIIVSLSLTISYQGNLYDPRKIFVVLQSQSLKHKIVFFFFLTRILSLSLFIS